MTLRARSPGDAAAVHRASGYGDEGARDLCQRRSGTAAPARPLPSDRSSAPRGAPAADRARALTCSATATQPALDPVACDATKPRQPNGHLVEQRCNPMLAII